MKRVHNEDEVTQKKNLMDVDEFTDQFDEATHSKCFLYIWTTYITRDFLLWLQFAVKTAPVIFARKKDFQKYIPRSVLYSRDAMWPFMKVEFLKSEIEVETTNLFYFLIFKLILNF